jgi:solute:Na+ symporter, SSS family
LVDARSPGRTFHRIREHELRIGARDEQLLGAKVRSVPEYLRLRFGEAAHAFNAGTFAVATVLISGVNLYALALIIHLMLGWSVTTAILVAAAIVLVYITLGGLTSAIYSEVLQFFVIVASLLPLTIVALGPLGPLGAGWGQG